MVGFKCDHCPRTYAKKKNRNSHMKYSHSEEEFPCNLCSKIFKASPALKRHIAAVHENKKISCYVCDLCKKTFTARRNFVKHFHKDHSNRKFDCKQCMKTFSVKYLLNRHMKCMHGVHICKQCKQVFRAFHSLQRHIKDIHSNVRYECDHCRKTYKIKLSLALHMISVHNTMIYVCELCKKVFHSEVHLRRHEKEVHTVSKVICDNCKHTFCSKLTLKNHFKRVCFAKKRICNECKSVFKNEYHLKRHVNEVHRKIFFKCELCEKYLKTKYSLQNHISNEHADGEKLPCHSCSESFTSKLHLYNHINIIHKQTHVKCKYCPVIRKKTYFKKHTCKTIFDMKQKRKLLHTNFVCDLCQKSFEKRNLLITHLRKFHRETITKARVLPEFLNTGHMKSKPLSTFEMNSEPNNVKIDPLDVVGDVELKMECDEDIDSRPEVLRREKPVSLSTVHISSEPPSTSEKIFKPNNVENEPPYFAGNSLVEENMCVVLKQERVEDIVTEPEVLEKDKPESLSTVHMLSEPPSTFEEKFEPNNIKIEAPDVVGRSSLTENMCFVLKQEHDDDDIVIEPEVLQKDKPESLSTVHIISEPANTFEMNSEPNNVKIELPDVVVDSSVEENMCVVLKQERDEDIDIGPEVLQKYDEPLNFSIKSE